MRSDKRHKLNYFQLNEIESVTFDILMLHTNPITIGINSRPLNQSNFLDIFRKKLPKYKTSYRKIYYLGDFNLYLGNLNPLITTKT